MMPIVVAALAATGVGCLIAAMGRRRDTPVGSHLAFVTAVSSGSDAHVPEPSPRPRLLAGMRGSSRARARLRDADLEVPDLLDLLAAGSVAGSSATMALRDAAVALRGPLAEELTRSLRQIELGTRWRDELRSLAARLDLPDLSRVVSTLVRTDELGVSLAEPLSRLAAQVRARRRAAAAERARKAPVKMLFPLVFLILPAFLLLTVVPVAISTIRSI